ncbi:hypothetical protein N177_2054 [Lutibaculum baratangense AMV1]|uniref:Flavin reductase like domain-containing protein n=1 Tax=Lutibaculum baratangense AMV1 TaxID=631454 RepID=V4RPD7_9HYPH|nr:hypothetical protein N177_2054 [Lutibaculum baratangense AMV1]
MVTTVGTGGDPRGFTANSFTSVSLDPPLVLICIANGAASKPAFDECASFAINVLKEEQRETSGIFASKSPKKFDRVDWHRGSLGAPLIADCLATFECTVFDRRPAGDHLVLIGRVEAFSSSAGRPLVYGQGGYLSLGLEQEVVARPPGKDVIVSCIVEHEDRVLLVRRPEGLWTLPHASLVGSGKDLVPLKQAFRRIGVRAQITFLYSVFESDAPDTVHIVYRGKLQDEPGGAVQEAVLAGQEDVRWDSLWPPQLRGMLRRFFQERAINQFGIYSDFEDGGRVARLTDDAEGFDHYLRRTSTGGETGPG